MNMHSVLSQLEEIEDSINSLIANVEEHNHKIASELEQISYSVADVLSDITDINKDLIYIENQIYDIRF